MLSQMFSNEPEAGQTPNIVIAGRYKMLRVIGSGSFGEVFEGIDIISNLKVAIKLEPTGRDSPSLLYEARILRLL